jgi:hypothetical protein
MKKRVFSIALALALVLSCSVPALAATDDSRVASATLAGVSINLGTPVIATDFGSDPATIANFSAGSVTLTTDQLTDAELLITEQSGWDYETKAIKVTSAEAESFASIDGITDNSGTYTATYADGDYVVFYVTDDGDVGSYIYAILIAEGDGGGPNPDSTGEKIVTGEGDTEYIDMEIYAVTLPTNDNFNFTLDPQGLLAIAEDDTKDFDELKGGRIFPLAPPAATINNSAVDITLSVSLQGTGEATFIGYSEGAITAVEADDANNVLLYAVPSSKDIFNTSVEYAASDKGYVITGAESELKFVLTAAKYEVTNDDGEYKPAAKPNTGHGTAIQLGGYVNSKADWSDYADGNSAVGLDAVFSFAKASEEESGTAQIEGIPGLITAPAGKALTVEAPESEITVGFTGEEVSTEKTITRASITNNAPLVVDFTFGETELVDIRFASASVLQANQYSFDTEASTITFVASRASSIKSGAATYFTITLSDESTYQLNFS